MIYVFKIFGACFMICSCWGYGVYKSLDLKNKRDNMANLILGLDTFQNNIRISLEETLPLFKNLLTNTTYSIHKRKSCRKRMPFSRKTTVLLPIFYPVSATAINRANANELKHIKKS